MERPWLQQSSEQQIKYIFENTEDCEFLVGMKDVENPKSVKFFKEILSSVSPVMERMFNGDFKEAKSFDPVLIEDIYFKDFEQFLSFVKNTQAYVTNWISLYRIAKKYMAEELIKSIIAFLEIDRSACKSLCLLQIKRLEGMSYTIHCDRLVKAMQTPFLHCLDPSTFFCLVKRLNDIPSKISQVNMFIAIDNYCDRESNFSSLSEKSYFEALYVNALSFSGLTTDEFRDFVEPSDLLDKQTKLKILLKILK